MCVGLPAKVMTMKDGMAVVDASGAKREVSAELIENLEPGDYVMVHAGIAIAKITEEDEDEAEEWENEGEVDGRETKHDSLVDDPSLQRWENAATDNGLHQKGCAESGVALLHVFQGNAVDGWEHDGHKCRDDHQTVESRYVDQQDGAKGTD